MSEIKEYRLFILDPNQDTMIESNDISENEDELTYIDKKIKKIHNSNELKKSLLKRQEITNSSFYNYMMEMSDFNECANELATSFYDYKREIGVYHPFDLIIVDYVFENNHYFGIIECSLKKGYTHMVMPMDDGVVNQIQAFDSIISESITKEDNIFIYDLLNETVLMKEIAFEKEGQIKHFFSDLMFPCQTSLSEKEVVSILHETVNEVASLYEMPFSEVVPSFKVALSAESFDVDMIADEIFEDNMDAKKEFIHKIEDKGVHKEIDFDTTKLKKKDRVVKFITENGIEITIPSEYIRRKDKVEIVNNSDGTVSIEIKNVNELKNR